MIILRQQEKYTEKWHFNHPCEYFNRGTLNALQNTRNELQKVYDAVHDIGRRRRRIVLF